MSTIGRSSYNATVIETPTSRSPGTAAESAPAPLLALRPAALFDGAAAQLIPSPTVLVERGRILAVEAGRIELPAAAHVVDLDGCTLLPGLVDTHVHLCLDSGSDPFDSLGDRDREAVVRAATEAAKQQLRGGVTTVRDLGDLDYLTLGLRSADAREPDLPTIVCAGPPITTPGGHCCALGGATSVGTEELRAAVAEHAERGVDVIKVMASGGFLTPGSEPETPQFGPEELRTVVDEAHRRGLAVTAHAHSTDAVRGAIDAGVDGIEHCSFLTPDGVDAPDDLIERIAHQRVVVGATVGLLPGSTPPPFIASLLPDILANHGRLHRAGAAVVAGTDAGIGPIKPHGVLPHAAPHLVDDIGLTPYEALRSMTAGAAQVCGLGTSKGRIAPGYDADLLAVRGDPIADLAALTLVAAVYRQGRPVPLGSEANP